MDFYYEDLDFDYKMKLIKRFGSKLVFIVNDLVILYVKYYDFNNVIKEGKLVCNRLIVDKLISIFKTLYENKYQIDKIKLSDEYDFDDFKSMADNNSSCFNYRKIKNTDTYSKHAFGLAVDINTVYNPYVVENEDGTKEVYPESSILYLDRSKDFEHKIDRKDLCYKLFKENGFDWGGDWSIPDYQHFEFNKEILNKTNF